MKLRRCAVLLASLCLAASAVAGPALPVNEKSLGRREAGPGNEGQLTEEQKKEEERKKKEEEEKERKEHEELMKYFHEPGRTDLLGHYDVRYYGGLVSYDERTDTLTHMIRAYLDWFRDKGLETWIAHGTLLGWWWNGKMLPWDWDVDTQVSGATLAHLAAHHNRTKIDYISDDGKFKRTYLLDVNPWQWERVHGDGFNIIDARWIDIHNGLFIDITGVSETEPDNKPGIWSCKNQHNYRVTDLYPLRESIYEGVKALIPFAYEKILREEYQAKSLSLDMYEGHHWDINAGDWIKTPELIKQEEEEFAKQKEAELKAKKEKKEKAE